MGLWNKGVERSHTGELRLDEIEIPDNLLNHLYGNTYTVNTNVLVSKYGKGYYFDNRKKRLDMSRPQIIWWGKFMERQLLETDFAITDPSSEIYITGGSRNTTFKISRYDTNIISERYGTKCDFIQSIKNIGRTGGYNYMNLDIQEFLKLKHVVKYMSNFIEPEPCYKEMFYEWLDKDVRYGNTEIS